MRPAYSTQHSGWATNYPGEFSIVYREKGETSGQWGAEIGALD
ncbi:hypothetical protein [Ihuprevotella massiliensis]